ncbi:hypothetical protein PilKf_02334 [Pillotina sp. SPG140]|jgi:uncharacterized pyridoxamine 5'-phosphate oxidase family protein
MALNYETEIEKIYICIDESKIMALATCSKERTTVRMMSCIQYNHNIIFQTSTDLLKYTQICENNHIALCFENIQIEGIVHIRGKPLDEKNQNIIDIYKKYNKNSYETYSHLEKERLIEVTPVKITRWDYDNGKPYRIFISINERKAHKEMYELD